MAYPLRIGLIGCGAIAHLAHLEILTHLPAATLVALAEPDRERQARARRRAPQTRAFVGYEELLEQGDVDAVVICLPNPLHAPAAVEAFRRKKHVYVEKPIAVNTLEARQILAAWRTAGVVGMVGFNYRFNPLYRAVRRYVESGRLGRLIGARSVFSTSVRPWGPGESSGQSRGGVLLDLASHHIDLIRFFFGQEVREVSAWVGSFRSEDDSAAVQLRLASGLLAQCWFSTSTVEDDRFEIFGDAGKLTVDRYLSVDVDITSPTRRHARLKRVVRGLRSLARVPYLLQKMAAPGHEPSYRIALTRFADAAQAGRTETPDLWDGYYCLRVLEAAKESARTGRVVALADDEADSLEHHGGTDGRP